MPAEILEEDPPEKRRPSLRPKTDLARYPLLKVRTCEDCAEGEHGRCAAAGRDWCLCEQEDHNEPFPP